MSAENRTIQIDRLRAAIASKGGNFLEFHRLGVLLCQAGDLQGAIEAQSKALARNPRLAAAQFQLGILYKQTGRPGEAIAALQAAIALNHRTPLTFHQLGLLLGASGDAEGARDALTQAIALNGSLPELHFRLGLAYRDLGQPEMAVEKLRDAIALKGDAPQYHIQLALLLKAQKDHMGAADALRRAIALSPGLSTPYFQLSLLLRSCGRTEEALDMIGKAIERNGRIPQFHLQLMTLLLDKGEVGRARRVLDDLGRINPAMSRARKPDIQLRSLLKEGKVAIIPAGFRCFTKGIIRERLRFAQPSLPFDAGFFPPSSIISVLKDPCVRIAHRDSPVNYSVCLKHEKHLDPERGLGIWFRRTTYQEVDDSVTSLDKAELNRYLDTAYCYYTLDEGHQFVLAHYNWHQYACVNNPQRCPDPAINIPAISDMLNRRIERMFGMCRAADFVFFLYSETQSYRYMKIDDTDYSLEDLSGVVKMAQTLFPARVIALDVKKLLGPETLLGMMSD